MDDLPNPQRRSIRESLETILIPGRLVKEAERDPFFSNLPRGLKIFYSVGLTGIQLVYDAALVYGAYSLAEYLRG